jgi:signal transduction histidine kinase
MIYKTITSIILVAFVGIYIVTMYGTQRAFATVNNNVNDVEEITVYTQEMQKETIDSLAMLTEVVDNLSTELFIAQVEIEELKKELSLPNRLDEKADILFEALVEE